LGKILFISSYNTGYGHRSITESLREQIARIDPSFSIEEVDGFMLGGMLPKIMSRMYNKVVVSAPLLWKVCYYMGDIFSPLINFFSACNIRKGLIKLVEESHPDLIVVVHPGFVNSTLDVLEDAGFKIPVAVMVADLDNVSNLWADKRSAFTLCPTENSRRKMLKLGLPEDKTRVFGFPIRERFNNFDPGKGISPAERISSKGTLTFLLANGSQGTGYFSRITDILLRNFNCRVIILAGSNKALKNDLEKTFLPLYQDKVMVCGFTEKVEEYMAIADILIIRASPNVLTEAVNMCKPLIVTGALTGQEEKNPEFVSDNKLGVVCRDIQALPDAIKELLSDNGKKLKEIYRHQLEFRKPDAAGKTAEFLVDIISAFP
jgi:processive 1,2-diacylglycerol beta-glucosyltransferase